MFRCKDKDGSVVICTKQTWENHIVAEHPEMKACQSYVKDAIEKPYQVYQDGRNPGKRVIYKPFVLPPPYQLQYLRVVVEYRQSRGKSSKGYVVTAFPCQGQRKGDILIWSGK
ncbi:MAG: hypothetical protein HY673_14885 [Chloroflexi bacterium]|nr:hypothetical protein [Chloroflexota bacterium]